MRTSLLAAACVACDDSTTDTEKTADTGTAAATEGTVTVIANNLDFPGNGLVIFVADDRQAPTVRGSFCEILKKGPVNVQGVVSSFSGDQCTPDAELTFPAGTYEVYGGIFPQGKTTPDLCIETTVDVDGDVAITVPAPIACP